MTDWTKKKYNEYYNAYVPWLEDKYLAWFGENKTSYVAKGACSDLYLSSPPPMQTFLFFRVNASLTLTDQLRQTKITGDKNVDAVQEGVAEGVGGQFGSGGLLGGVGELASKEGVNRAERGDTGPLDKQKVEAEGKGWGSYVPGSGWFGGDGGKK